jgi:hypothetical protein
MTEADWLTFTDTTPLLGFLRGKASDRKLRLFAVACAYDVWPVLRAHPGMAAAVETAEAFADGRAGEAERAAAHAAITDATLGSDSAAAGAANAFGAAWYASGANTLNAAKYAARSACSAAADAAYLDPPDEPGTPAELSGRAGDRAGERVARLLRDVVENPFRPVAFDPDWRTSAAVALARQMYDARDFAAMPVLADALQDAGCEDADVLAHCRGPGPHVRGCWVVDLVLGKA